MLKGTLNTSNLPNHLWRQIIIALNAMVPFFRYLNLGPRARVLPPDSTPPSARARTHNIHNMCSITPIFTCVFGGICPWHTPIVSVHEMYIHTYIHTYVHTYRQTYRHTYIHVLSSAKVFANKSRSAAGSHCGRMKAKHAVGNGQHMIALWQYI